MLAASASASAAQAPGSYADVHGLRIYYETHGRSVSDEPPLILLHGAVGGIEMFGPNLGALAKERRVIALNLQGHGKTADIDRPLRFELMADDVASLMKHLRVERADVMGYSLGGGVALQTAIRHPQLVRKLVLVSTSYRRDAYYPEVRATFDQMGPAIGEMVKKGPLGELYPRVEFPTLFGKIGELMRRDFNWTSDVAALKAQTLLVFADADTFDPALMVEFYRLLGGGVRDAGIDGAHRPATHLAVIPGTTHYNILSSGMVADLVRPFLATSTPAAVTH